MATPRIQPKAPRQPTGLAAEIGKRTPFDLPEQEAMLNLVRTLSVVTAGHEQLMKHHGLSGATYNVLRILRGSGPEGRPSSEIGRDMVVRVPDITRLVDRITKSGLAERCSVVGDRRVVQVKITAKGLELLATLDEPVRQMHKSQFKSLTRAELTELNRLLVKARDSAPQ